ncbi:Os07g0124650, partial [Oryza sativa Japonica Group]
VPGDASVLRRPLTERVDGLAVVHRLLLPAAAGAAALAATVGGCHGRHAVLAGGDAAGEGAGAHGQGERVVQVLRGGGGGEDVLGGVRVGGARGVRGGGAARGHPARHGGRGRGRLLVGGGHERRRGRAAVQVARLEVAVLAVPGGGGAASAVVEAGGVVQAQRHRRLRRAEEVLKLGP